MSDLILSLAMFHPEERRLWILELSPLALSFVEGDRVSKVDNRKLFAGEVETRYAFGHGLYFDPGRNKPMLWVS